MKCDGIQEKLSAMIDGELPDEIAAVVERHLETCAECARIRAELSGVSSAFRRLPKAKAPAGFAQGVARAIAQLPAETTIVFPRRRRVIEWSIAAAAAVLIAVNVVYVIDYRRAEDARPATPSDREARKVATERPPKSEKSAADIVAKKEVSKESAGRDLRVSKGGESFDNKAKEEKRPAEPEVAKNDTERPTMKKGYDDDRTKQNDREVVPQIVQQDAPTPESAAPAPPSEQQIFRAPAKPEETARIFSGTEIEIVTIAATDVKAALAKVDEILATSELASLENRGGDAFRYRAEKSGDDGKYLLADVRLLACNESQRTLLMKELAKVGTVLGETAGEGDKIAADSALEKEKPSAGRKDQSAGPADEFKKREQMLEKTGPAQTDEQKELAHPAANAMPKPPSPAGDKPGIATGGVVTGQRQILIRIVESPQPK